MNEGINSFEEWMKELELVQRFPHMHSPLHTSLRAPGLNYKNYPIAGASSLSIILTYIYVEMGFLC